MQSPCVDACKTFSGSIFQLQLNGNQTDYRSFSSFSSARRRTSYPCISCNLNDSNGPRVENQRRVTGVRAKGKENVWSIDNEMAKAGKEKERMMRRKKNGGKRVRTVSRRVGKVMVSGSMLVEVETILQTQEPVIRPAWRTFASSVSGIWKGVGAVYSPITAEMEPVEIGGRNENLFDCYTLSHIEALPSTCEAQSTQLHRKVNWVTLNPYGEAKSNGGVRGNKKHDDISLPKIESFDFGSSDVMEEDVIGMEPGLVFFEDGSYSRGPVDIPIGELDETKYYISPTFKFEQCLVKGCHKRLRLVHTIEFSNGGSDIQIMRVAVYEEEWVSPSHIPDCSELELDLKPFSQRKRVQPSELTGSWKVFEVNATPIYGEDLTIEEGNGAPYVYLCTENLNKRSLPENPVYFGEEEMVDMQDVTVLWLPGGVTAYVDVKKDGVLCIGVGWYSDEGINLVMERDYGLDGKFREVRWKSEMKRRWTNPPPIEQSEASTVGLDEKMKRRVLLTFLVGPIMAPAFPSFGKTKKQNPYDERRLLEQNKRIQRENNVPDEFPNFVREGFTVKVVASENYVTRDSGLILRDISLGQGECPKAGQQVTFHYVGYNESGRRIDSTYIQGSPAKVRLGNNALIPGFEEGIRDMKPGGRRRLIIPPELGPPVGPSTFFSSKQFEVFDVELLSIEDCTRRTIGFYSDVVCG